MSVQVLMINVVSFLAWCNNNDLTSNISKTYELVMDYNALHIDVAAKILKNLNVDASQIDTVRTLTTQD